MKEYKVKVDKYGTTRWCNEAGELHRENGPAAEYADGYKAWYINGERHREDGPAVEWADGTKFWYINYKLHREDGPAIEWANGTKKWFINGEHLTEEEFNNRSSIPEYTMEELVAKLGNFKIKK